jgi:hypothetical protein
VIAAIDHHYLGGDGAAGRGQEEHRGVGYLSRLDRPAERRTITIDLQNIRESRDS